MGVDDRDPHNLDEHGSGNRGPVNVPRDAPYLFALGTYRGMSRTVLRVTTVDGVTGLGATPSTYVIYDGPGVSRY